MAKKNRIFSSSNPYKSNYYSTSARRRRKIKKYKGAEKKWKKIEDRSKEKDMVSHERYKAIMDNIRKEDREEVRGMDYEDVFDAADALIDEEETGYWTADQLEDFIINYLNDEEDYYKGM